MFSLNNHSLFHSHNDVLLSKSAICLSGFILRCTIHLEVLFILIGAGVSTWVIHKYSIYNVLFIFFIAVTKHLTKYHEGGETDCDSWLLGLIVHDGGEDRQNCLVRGGGFDTGDFCTWLWSRKQNIWAITVYKTPCNQKVVL